MIVRRPETAATVFGRRCRQRSTSLKRRMTPSSWTSLTKRPRVQRRCRRCRCAWRRVGVDTRSIVRSRLFTPSVPIRLPSSRINSNRGLSKVRLGQNLSIQPMSFATCTLGMGKGVGIGIYICIWRGVWNGTSGICNHHCQINHSVSTIQNID